MRLRALTASVLVTVLAFSTSPSVSASTTVLQDARMVRSEVLGLTGEYSRQYAPRVSPDEQRELRTMVAQARRELNALVGSVRRAERSGKPADWTRAAAAHRRARDQAAVQFERARTILGPHLSLGEQLAAYGDYSAAMRDFDALGSRIAR